MTAMSQKSKQKIITTNEKDLGENKMEYSCVCEVPIPAMITNNATG